MATHNILLTVQYITVVVLFVEIVIENQIYACNNISIG